MSTVIVEDVPKSLKKKFWNKISFAEISWIYWDWMDWCQYWEVIPSEEDIESFNSWKIEKLDTNWVEFLSNLINR